MKILTTPFNYNDGGRKEAGYKGDAGDCVVRSIAIATEQPYQKVYLDLKHNNTLYAESHYDRTAKRIKKNGSTPRNGNSRQVQHNYILSFGFKWVATMGIGTGCKVHLCKEELPDGRLIVKVSKHMTAVIDGVINDTHNPARGATRCVYGYYLKQ